MQAEINFPNTDYTFADFFSGCGGFSLGFIQAGLKCISALEFNQDAAWTYWYNLCYNEWSHLWIDPNDTRMIEQIQKKWNKGKTSNWLFEQGIPDNWLNAKEPMPCLNLFVMDITKLEPEDWMQIIGVREREVKIFIGGPPCQGFSTSGKRDILDERNKLALRMIYYAKVCKPKYVLIENVPGLLSLGKKNKDSESPFVLWIREAFEDAGYYMSYQVHNAADYGVPQNRKRVLFFAVRLDEMEHELQLDLEKVDIVQNVLEAIGHLPPIEAGETWKGGNYIYKDRKDHIICTSCFKYNQKIRLKCHNCNNYLDFSAGEVLIIS